MITKNKEIEVQDNIKEAEKWLKSEYPKGIDLVYIDYRDQFEDMATLEDVLKGNDKNTWEWFIDSEYSTIDEIERNYIEHLREENNGKDVELSEEVRDYIREWLQDNDISRPVDDMIKNTGDKLFYLETKIETLDYNYVDQKEYKEHIDELKKMFSKTDEQAKEIEYVMENQFYSSLVSFYFYLSPLDVYKLLGTDKKYITIKNAYFSTIDRIQGSNWLGNNGVFTITIPTEEFFKNFYLDENKNNGYGWGSIAGQTGYDDASIEAVDTVSKDSILIDSETSERAEREKRLAEKWKKTGECTFGDMNYSRHKDMKYKNEYPCGSTCQKCGTFFID